MIAISNILYTQTHIKDNTHNKVLMFFKAQEQISRLNSKKINTCIVNISLL